MIAAAIAGAVAPHARGSWNAERRRAGREELASGYLPTWAGHTEKQLGEGPFVAGVKLNVADLKLYMVIKWITSGTIDHIPGTVFDAFPKLKRLAQAVGAHDGVKSWLTK